VHDVALVSGVQSLAGVAQPFQSLLAVGAAVADHVGQAAPAHVLHHDERLALVLADVEDRHHVGVAGQPRGGAGLALEAGGGGLVAQQPGGQQLDRHHPAQRAVLRRPHRRHPAVGDVGAHLEAVGQLYGGDRTGHGDAV
jgi:hypothetical protein